MTTNEDIFERNWNDKTILIVEDDDVSFMLLNEFLIDTKAEILHASNGKEAIELYQNNRKIDLILMDIQIPVIDGYEALKKIKELNPDIPIVAQTAFGDVSEESEKRNLKFDGYIPKPIIIEDLFDVIGGILDDK